MSKCPWTVTIIGIIALITAPCTSCDRAGNDGEVALSNVPEQSIWELVWQDAYNKSCDLIEQIEQYRKRSGVYPELVHADKIYRTQDNQRFRKKHGIRLSGPPGVVKFLCHGIFVYRGKVSLHAVEKWLYCAVVERAILIVELS